MAQVVIQQPGASVQGAPQNVRNWSTGVCACCSNCKTCLCGCLCFPCLLCRLAGRMNESCCVSCFLPGGLVAMRTKLRVQYGISGSICGDVCTMCCCNVLAVCQMDRELEHLGL